MATIAESGAREALVKPESPSSIIRNSPRCEAFVMTGEKILNLNHHVSPSYAKVIGDQLPPSMQINQSPKRPPLADFPSVRRSRLPVSVSQPDAITIKHNKIVVEEKEAAKDVSSVGPCFIPVYNETQDVNQDAETSCVKKFERAATTTVMDSSMHSSYYKSAFSNPQLSRTHTSAETFVISSSDSPTKQSTVTVNAGLTSVSPIVRRAIKSPANHDELESLQSDICEEKDAVRFAYRLYHLEDSNKEEVSARLNDPSEFSALVSTKYLELFAFSGMRIDCALREFLSRVELRGESSERERLLRFFSSRYHSCNPSLYASLDDVHSLTCALLLLNSDLHGINVGRRMSVRDFVNNLSHTGGQYKRELLKQLYMNIKQQPILHDSKKQKEDIAKKVEKKKTTDSMQLLFEVDPDTQVEYKSGWLMRKCIYDADGARTPYGRRGWRMWFARLRGLVLYLEKDEGDKKRNRFETFSNAILLHHAYAEAAGDYMKKQNIFRLKTADLGEFLFQTSNSMEVSEWIRQLNFVSAAFSSRALPPSASSCSSSFSYPRLPRMPSSSPLSHQLKAHESNVSMLREQLRRVQMEAPPLKSRGRLVEEFFFRERYITQEITRYETYCQLLRSRLGYDATSDCISVGRSQSLATEEMDKISYRQALNN